MSPLWVIVASHENVELLARAHLRLSCLIRQNFKQKGHPKNNVSRPEELIFLDGFDNALHNEVTRVEIMAEDIALLTIKSALLPVNNTIGVFTSLQQFLRRERQFFQRNFPKIRSQSMKTSIVFLQPFGKMATYTFECGPVHCIGRKHATLFPMRLIIISTLMEMELSALGIGVSIRETLGLRNLDYRLNLKQQEVDALRASINKAGASCPLSPLVS
ncbi:hypothetical protein Tco_0842419 [Tanacetum coccineum]|uniref:Uncharacterized protein n=1 Tax=Tanacetum coccineum TaxID=301880 RepID=A0ABQ5B1X8_9ASTR